MSKIEMGACGFEEMALNGKFLEWESGHLFILLSAPGDFTTCCDITAMLLPENLCYTYENKANATIPAISIPEFYNMDITTLQSSQHRSPIERTRDPAFPGYHPPAGPVSFRFTCSL